MGAKSTTSLPLDLHFSVIKCHCQTYDDNIGPKLKKPSLNILGAYNMFDNKFDQYRTEVCPEIDKITFLNNAPLSDLSWKTEKCRQEDLRGGAFGIHPFNISL